MRGAGLRLHYPRSFWWKKDDMLQQGYPWTPVPCCRIAARRARALILFSRPSPPTWELPPSLPHSPTQQPTGAHSRRCMGLRVGARVSERRPPEFLSAHMRVPSTVNGVLGLNLSLLSRIKAHFCRIWPFIGTTTTGSSLVHRELYCVPACAALRLGGDAPAELNQPSAAGPPARLPQRRPLAFCAASCSVHAVGRCRVATAAARPGVGAGVPTLGGLRWLQLDARHLHP